jgi:hypothetical protein
MKRMFSRCLAIIYGLTNVFCVYAGETNYWEERRQAVQRRSSPNRLASFHVPRSAELVAMGPISSLGTQQPGQPMPASHRTLLPGMEKDWGWLPELVAPYGEIREIHVASRSGAPVVFHLQDVHEVEEAQKNLAGLLESFQKQRGISLVGLEGAVGSFGLDFFREGPLESRKKLSDHFLELGYLTGPEVAGIVAETIPTLWGIEDLSLYRGHVEAFEQSEAGRTQARQFLTALSNEADRTRETIYSPALMALDDHRRAYLSHRESLGDYVPALWSALKSNKKAYPQVALLVKLLAQERTLDFKEVERQRVRLAEVLAQRLAPGDLDRLVKASLAYRSGRQTAGAYQKHLATVCRQNNIRLDTFGPLAVYMDYVQGADPLDAGKLLDELDRLELVALTGTAKTNEEKLLVEVFRGLALLDKLTNHGLTPQEWGLMKKDDHSLENVRSILAKISPTLVSKTVSLPDLSPYMEFCKKAEQRNGALVKNLLAKMKADKVNTTVLVAGGFHTDGMTALLKEANASYVVITPKISKVPDTRPLDIFVRAPLPLEKLLAGDVIHLAYPRLAQKQGTLNETPSALDRQLTLKDAWDTLMGSIGQEPPPQKPSGSVVKSLIMGAIISLMSSGFVGHIKQSKAEELTNPINNSEEVAGAVSFSANPNSEDEEARLRGIVDQHLPVVPGAPTERDAVNNIAAALDDALSLDPSLAVELAKRVVLSQVPNLWLAHYSKLVLMMGKSAEGTLAETRELVDLAEVMLNEFPGPSAGVSAMDAWVLVLDVFERLLPNLSNESQREGFIALYELAHRTGEKDLMVNDPAIPLINRIEGGWMTLENAREIAAKADVPKWMRVIADRLIAQSEEDTENAVQNEDLSSPALVYLNNRKSPNKADLWRNVRDWAREILLGTEGTLENRVFKLNPMEAYVLMDVLSRPDPTMLVDSQLAAQVRAQLWVKMMAGLKAEFDQGVDRDGESPYGPLTLLAFFGDGFGQKAFFDYAIESGKGNKFFRMVPANLQGHVSAVARKVSPTISASPLGLLPLIGRPIYNFLISNGVNRRLAAGIAGVVEQGVLVLMASGLAWLLNWIFGIGFIWGLILTTAIIWKMFPKSHGERVFVYEYIAGWRLKLVDTTDDHIRSLRRASHWFFGSFLVVTLIPIVIPLLGIAVPGSLDQWFFAGATISSLFHGLRNSFNPVPGKVAAMGSASGRVQFTNGEGINRVLPRNEGHPHSSYRTLDGLLESEEGVSDQFIPLLVEEYRFLPREPGSVRAWKFTNFIELLRHYFWDGKSPVSVVDLGADSDVFMGNLKIKIPISNNLAIDISPRRGSSVVQADGGSWSELSKVSPDVESTDLVVINHIDHRGLSMLGNAWGLVRLGGLLMVTVAESDLMSANGDTPTAVEMVLSRLPEEARSVAQVVITKNLDYPRSSNDLSPALLIVAKKPIGPPNKSGVSNDQNAVEIQRTLLGGESGAIIPVTALTVSIDALRKKVADDRQLLAKKRDALVVSLGLGTDVSEESIAAALARRHGGNSVDKKTVTEEIDLFLASSLVGLDGNSALEVVVSRATQIVDAYHAAQGLFDSEKALTTAIVEGRDIALELTVPMVRRDLTLLTPSEKAQWDRLKRLARAASKGELQKPVRLVIPEGIAPVELETVLSRGGAGALLGNVFTKPKNELALAEGKYSLKRFVDWVRRDKRGEIGSIEMYLMSRNEWDWDSLVDEIRRNVRLLVDVLPGLVMDATRGLPEGLKRIVVVNMSA